jgi:hypothetical protein
MSTRPSSNWRRRFRPETLRPALHFCGSRLRSALSIPGHLALVNSTPPQGQLPCAAAGRFLSRTSTHRPQLSVIGRH